jgi:hypothetical protein
LEILQGEDIIFNVLGDLKDKEFTSWGISHGIRLIVKSQIKKYEACEGQRTCLSILAFILSFYSLFNVIFNLPCTLHLNVTGSKVIALFLSYVTYCSFQEQIKRLIGLSQGVVLPHPSL